MTTLHGCEKTCFVCGKTALYIRARASNHPGPSDLDLRPPPLTRDTIAYWVQRCSACGYCAADVAVGPDEARDIVQSEAYRRQLEDAQYPELANNFLCAAMILGATDTPVEAAWAHLHAAWASDDEGKDRAAARLRLRAAVLFQRLREQGIRFGDPAGGEEALLADLLRRSGDPSGAAALSRQGLEKAQDRTVRGILRYQIDLAETGDVKAHSVADIFQGA